MADEAALYALGDRADARYAVCSLASLPLTGWAQTRPGTAPTTAMLAVEVTAEGDVTGAAGAIACPPRCDTMLPLGSAFELTAVARPGFSFEGWRGACTGAGT